jgi:predicted dehydrogenase
MTRPLRVGVIGANPNRSWAKDSHIPALLSLENVQLAAVATTSRASAEAAAVAFGVRAAYDDPLALITASDIDIVSVRQGALSPRPGSGGACGGQARVLRVAARA